MKYLKSVLFVVIMSLVLACDKDDDKAESETGPEEGIISLKVDGSQFSTSSSTTTITSAEQNGITGLQISGSEISSGKVINILVVNFTGEGTYAMEGTPFQDAPSVGIYSEIDVANNALKQWVAPHGTGGNVGTVVFTSVSETNVKGTFSFTGQNLDDESFKVVTEGTFNLDR